MLVFLLVQYFKGIININAVLLLSLYRFILVKHKKVGYYSNLGKFPKVYGCPLELTLNLI